jgi:iron complex outermembrane receptor protein
LSPERARTWTVGLRWDVPGSVSIDLSYWSIDFADRIQLPPVTETFLLDPRYNSIVIRNPSESTRARACSAPFAGNFGPAPGDCMSAPIEAIIDDRWHNISRTTTSGFDASMQWGTQTALGYVGLDAKMTYVMDFTETPTPDATPISLLDRTSSPLRFHLREGINWSKSGWSAAAFVNYTGAYVDNFSLTSRKVDPWTTIDLQFGYQADPRHWLAGFKVALSVENVFNTDPPFVNNPTGVGYDRENADITKRLISLRATKNW